MYKDIWSEELTANPFGAGAMASTYYEALCARMMAMGETQPLSSGGPMGALMGVGGEVDSPAPVPLAWLKSGPFQTHFPVFIRAI